MNRLERMVRVGGYALLFLVLLGGIAHADPLDDAAAKVGSFLQRTGVILTGLIPAVSSIAVGGLAVKRAASKAMGEEESMIRSGNQITEVVKLTAVGMGASLIVAIAGSVLK